MNIDLSEFPDLPGAVCAQADPDLFFPERGRPDMADLAKRVCDTCPLATRTACLEYALTIDENPHGIWAGTTPGERRPMRKARGNKVGRERTHCRNQHEYTPENTYIRPNGRRSCLTCQRASHKRHRDGVAA